MIDLGIKDAFILAGGKGERAKSISPDTQKVMIVSGTVVVSNTSAEVSGEKPNLWWNIELMRRYSIKRVILGVGHMAEKVEEYFNDGKTIGIEIIYSKEKEPLGTGGALKNAERYLNKGTFFMMNGDELKDFDLGAMLAVHRKNKAIATIALVEVDDVSSFGIADIEGERINRFVEKPNKEEAPSNLANAGLYILEPEAFNYIPQGKSSIERDVFPKIAESGRLFGFIAKGQWFPTDDKDRHERAQREWKGFR